MKTKLPQKAYDAVKLIEDSSYKIRAKNLESIEERGFALILYWNQIEAALKIIRYGYSIKDGWPDKLSFLGTTWKPLQTLKKDNITNYELVFGKTRCSLLETRNAIAHEGRNVPVENYIIHIEAALWAISELKQKVPSLEQLREKKRRSDAQLSKMK